MTRVRTRRDFSRLVLLLLLLLGLLSARGVLPCDENRQAKHRDVSAMSPHHRLRDIGERKYFHEGREWTNGFENEISGWSRRGGTRARRRLDETRVVATFAPETATDFRARHERRKFRRKDNDGTILNEKRSGEAFRAKRNFGRRQKTATVNSASNCEGYEEGLLSGNEGKDSWRGAARRNRSGDGVTDNPEARGKEGSNPVDWAEVNGSLSSSEEPFTGFEGSQKFPIKVTYKPPVAAQVEKFDRRHFGPPKVDVGETTLAPTYPSTVSPDLPKSPGRDVLHRHRKVDENTEEERRQEEGERGGDDETDDSWLPGASSGRRASNIPTAGKSSPADEKRVSSSTFPSPFPSTGIDARDIERESNGTEVKSSEKINVTILGLFEMTRGSEPRPEGTSELQAARLAVERVNEMNVLSKFRLRLIHNDTKVGTDRLLS